MGLFSFLKSAGSKMVEDKAAQNTTTTATSSSSTMDALKESARKSKISMLESAVRATGIAVENLSLDLDDDKVTAYGNVESTSAKEKVILVLGNVHGISTVDDRLSVVKTEPESDFYEVKKGDTLSKIAKAHYGDAMKYPVIFEANKPMLTNPDLIYPGQVLRIPKL